MAGIDPPDLDAIARLRDFHLDSGDVDQKIFSRALTGEVWLAHFASDAGVAAMVEKKVEQAFEGSPLGMSQPIALMQISESDLDTSAATESKIVQSINGWAEPAKLKRIAEEYFGVAYDQASLPKQIAVVDRWGKVRDRLDVDAEGFAETLRAAVSKYAAEQKPGPPTFGTVER